MTSTQRWIRQISLTVQCEKGGDTALDLSQFRVVFDISQAVMGKPCTATITVYNTSFLTTQLINVPKNADLRGEGLRVILSAGYEGDSGVIFDGDLWWISTGRESETDTFLRLVAATGDRAQQSGVTQASLPAGSSQEDTYKQICKELNRLGVSTTQMPPLTAATYLRGKVMYGPVEDMLNKLGASTGARWGYGNKGIIWLDRNLCYSMDEPVVVLTPSTGLIGRPELTPDGVKCRSLLNPALELGALVKLDNDRVTYGNFDTSISDGALVSNQYSAGNDQLDYAGIYRVVSRRHFGDTRGESWYTDLILFATSAATPVTQTPYTFTQN